MALAEPLRKIKEVHVGRRVRLRGIVACRPSHGEPSPSATQCARGLLVQQTDRRNAENVAETIAGATPRALQRLLTEAPWPTEPVPERWQADVGAHLNTPQGIVVLAERGLPKQGKKSVQVAMTSSRPRPSASTLPNTVTRRFVPAAGSVGCTPRRCQTLQRYGFVSTCVSSW
jgi:hypothetical protein